MPKARFLARHAVSSRIPGFSLGYLCLIVSWVTHFLLCRKVIALLKSEFSDLAEVIDSCVPDMDGSDADEDGNLRGFVVPDDHEEENSSQESDDNDVGGLYSGTRA